MLGQLQRFLGLVALVQNDIKRIIAYSTISQLGYMTAALGYIILTSDVPLITHAFFKALLFLCAGSIIIKCHHEQDIRKIGGLKIYANNISSFYVCISIIDRIPNIWFLLKRINHRCNRIFWTYNTISNVAIIDIYNNIIYFQNILQSFLW